MAVIGRLGAAWYRVQHVTPTDVLTSTVTARLVGSHAMSAGFCMITSLF